MVVYGALAQLARAPALQAGGHRFESDMLHHTSRIRTPDQKKVGGSVVSRGFGWRFDQQPGPFFVGNPEPLDEIRGQELPVGLAQNRAGDIVLADVDALEERLIE